MTRPFRFLARALPTAAALVVAANSAGAQVGEPPATGDDTLRLEILARQRAIGRAAEVFFDRTRPVEERALAAESAETFLEPAHVRDAAALARDAREAPRLRAQALLAIRPAVAGDDALLADVAGWVRARETPTPLRQAALSVAEALAISLAPGDHGVLAGAFRELLSDGDAGLRDRAFSVLAGSGDPDARQRLVEGLLDPTVAPLPAARSVQLLGLRPDTRTLAVLHRVMLAAPDLPTRREAIRLLGRYGPSRPYLVRYLRDPAEPEELRMAAIGALHAGAPQRFAEYAAPVVLDEGAGDLVRIYAIHAVRYLRPSLGRKERARFDQTVRRAALSARSAPVYRAAAEYLRVHGL